MRPLDIVLIVIDTLRPDHLGCYGDARRLSPAIDRLARDGVLFEQAVATAPITGPSHASLFTSRWACETGVRNNCVAPPDPALPMLAEIMDGLGHQTLGAISISPVARHYGFARGFHDYADSLGIGFLATADTVLARARRQLDAAQPPLFLWAHFSEPHEPYDAHGLTDTHAEIRLDGHVIARVPTCDYTPTALELQLPPRPAVLRFGSSAPFYVRALEIAGLDAAPPVLDPAEPPLAEMLEYKATIGPEGARRVRLEFALNEQVPRLGDIRARYALEVQAVDRRVGALLDELRQRGLYDDALIVFTADHGEALGERGLVGHVENLYDVLLHVPLIVKPPRGDGFAPGSRRRDLASLVDVVPTILAWLGRPPLSGARGRDLFAPGAARGEEELVFAETHRPQAQRTLFALRGARHKIIHEPARDAWEFYDLENDPDEQRNLQAEQGRRFRRWRQRLLDKMAHLGLDRADTAATPAIDERARRALRALGY